MHTLVVPALGPLNEIQAKYRTEMQKCAQKGDKDNMQSDQRGEWLSPLAEGVREVFTEKVTFAEKLDYSESSLKVMTCWSVQIGAWFIAKSRMGV